MRQALIDLLLAEAKADPDFVLITGDLGFSVVEPLQEMLGDRFINAGVAEANMVTLAGTLASQGFNVFTYSIAPFMTARCLEQIRNDICYPKRSVRLIGIGAGYSYGTLGPTHHALEDLNLLSHLPGMALVSPASVAELDVAHRAARDATGPVYYRISRENGPDRPAPDFSWTEGVVEYGEGSDICFITTGPILDNVLAAVARLEGQGIRAQVLSIPVLAPFPHRALGVKLSNAPIITVAEAFRGNPLEVGVMETVLDHTAAPPTILRMNTGHAFADTVGGTDDLRKSAGIDGDALFETARKLLK